jgi:hypothetical protein
VVLGCWCCYDRRTFTGSRRRQRRVTHGDQRGVEPVHLIVCRAEVLGSLVVTTKGRVREAALGRWF